MRLSFGGHVFYSYLCALNREDGLRLSKKTSFSAFGLHPLCTLKNRTYNINKV